MTVKELSRDQMEELKQSILCDTLQRNEGRAPYMGELADAESIVPDEMVNDLYGDTDFSEDDFFCSAGQE